MAKRLAVYSFMVWCALTADAAVVKISDMRSFPHPVWEMQTAVVPPGKKTQCMSGRLLAMADATFVGADLTDPPAAIFRYQNLGVANPVTGSSTLPALPEGENYGLLSGDTDFLGTPDGNLYFFAAAFSKVPLDVARPWFKHTFRGGFGWGARGILMVWRSTNCGNSFELVAEFDPSNHEIVGGQCGNPQNVTEPVNGEVRFDAGGSDGQLVRYSPFDKRFYLTFGCVGRMVSNTSPPTLGAGLNRTAILWWQDTGAPAPATGAERRKAWRILSTIRTPLWRVGVVRPSANTIVLATESGQMPVLHPQASLASWMTGGPETWPIPPGGNGPAGLGTYDGLDIPKTQEDIGGWVIANTVSTRAPGSEAVLMATPDETPISPTYGYRTFAFVPATMRVAELPRILPASLTPKNILFHLTAIDPGTGPILFYWADADTANKTVNIRGRFHYSATTFSQVFDIRRINGVPQVKQYSGQLQVGDYWGAGGFPINEGGMTRHVYYPAWIEENGTVSYARVEMSNDPGGIALAVNTIPQSAWKSATPTQNGSATAAAAQQARSYAERKRRKR